MLFVMLCLALKIEVTEMKVEKREGGGYHLYSQNESENMAIAAIIQVVFHKKRGGRSSEEAVLLS